MQIRNRILSAAWKLLAFAAGTLGILLQCGVFSGKPDFSVLNYFTLMSNILCAVYFLCAAVQLLRGCPAFWKQAKGALLLCILVTGMVYHFMLNGRFEMQGTLGWGPVLAINLGLLAGFLLLGLLLTAVDKAMARIGRSQP